MEDKELIQYLTRRHALLSELLGNMNLLMEGFLKAAAEDNPALAETAGYTQAVTVCANVKEILASYEAKRETKQ